MKKMNNNDDSICKFIFEQADVRGELVQLERSYTDIINIHQYAPGVSRVLGEFVAAAVLLSTTIKFEGRLILQAQGKGEIPLLMAECSNTLSVRAIVRGAEQATATAFSELLRDGHLAITIEPLVGQRYQGIVSLEGDTLAACLEGYFRNSEQLETRLWLACDGTHAAGLLLQQLPEQRVADETLRADQWQHLCTLAETVTSHELLLAAPQSLLHHLFHEDPLRLFPPQPVSFACSCSRERCLQALISLGAEQLESLLQEQQPVVMDCEFCNQHYEFGRKDFEPVEDSPVTPALH